MTQEPKWLEWAKKLQSIAQTGLTYSKDPYDRERFQQIRNISIEVLNSYTNVPYKKLRNLFANETGYATPKVDVRAAIFNENKILLTKEKSCGLWSLPGGWADIDYSLKETVVKEAFEETGVKVEPKRIIAVLDRNKQNHPPYAYGIYKIFVECDYSNGKFIQNIETEATGFFSLTNLPPLSIARNTKPQIALCFQARNVDYWETVFD